MKNLYPLLTRLSVSAGLILACLIGNAQDVLFDEIKVEVINPCNAKSDIAWTVRGNVPTYNPDWGKVNLTIMMLTGTVSSPITPVMENGLYRFKFQYTFKNKPSGNYTSTYVEAELKGYYSKQDHPFEYDNTTCMNVSGVLYTDKNSDCVHQQTDDNVVADSIPLNINGITKYVKTANYSMLFPKNYDSYVQAIPFTVQNGNQYRKYMPICTSSDSVKGGDVLDFAYSYKDSAANSSIAENQYTDALKLWPNPAKELIHVRIPDFDGIQPIQITNLTGKIILLTNATQEEVIIPVSNLEKGFYLVSLPNKPGLIPQKFSIF